MHVLALAVAGGRPLQLALWIEHAGATVSFVIRRTPMISKSKLGAMTFIAAIGLASPAFAASVNSPSATGGGSSGYNHKLSTDYRLNRHHVIAPHARDHHLPSSTK